jgi:hypothetical protein
MNGLKIAEVGNEYFIYGNTIPIKEILKLQGGKYKKEVYFGNEKLPPSWVFPKHPNVILLFNMLQNNTQPPPGFSIFTNTSTDVQGVPIYQMGNAYGASNNMYLNQNTLPGFSGPTLPGQFTNTQEPQGGLNGLPNIPPLYTNASIPTGQSLMPQPSLNANPLLIPGQSLISNPAMSPNSALSLLRSTNTSTLQEPMSKIKIVDDKPSIPQLPVKVEKILPNTKTEFAAPLVFLGADQLTYNIVMYTVPTFKLDQIVKVTNNEGATGEFIVVKLLPNEYGPDSPVIKYVVANEADASVNVEYTLDLVNGKWRIREDIQFAQYKISF